MTEDIPDVARHEPEGGPASSKRPLRIWHGLLFWVILAGFLLLPALGHLAADNLFLPFLLIFLLYCLVSPSLYRRQGLDHFAVYSKASGVLVVLFMVYMIFISAPPPPTGQRQLTSCKSSLKNIGTALDMYAFDNAKLYPSRLEEVVPQHLKSLPTCAAAGKNNYVYLRSEDCQAYTVYCRGAFHSKVSTRENCPQYDSFHGLIEGN
jgi:hypothetical protein